MLYVLRHDEIQMEVTVMVGESASWTSEEEVNLYTARDCRSQQILCSADGVAFTQLRTEE